MPVSEVVAFEGVNKRINYNPGKADIQASQLLEMGINNFGRRKTINPVTGLPLKEVIVGFSTESILDFLEGSLTPLLTVLKDGTIRE